MGEGKKTRQQETKGRGGGRRGVIIKRGIRIGRVSSSGKIPLPEKGILHGQGAGKVTRRKKRDRKIEHQPGYRLPLHHMQ